MAFSSGNQPYPLCELSQTYLRIFGRPEEQTKIGTSPVAFLPPESKNFLLQVRDDLCPKRSNFGGNERAVLHLSHSESHEEFCGVCASENLGTASSRRATFQVRQSLARHSSPWRCGPHRLASEAPSLPNLSSSLERPHQLMSRRRWEAPPFGVRVRSWCWLCRIVPVACGHNSRNFWMSASA